MRQYPNGAYIFVGRRLGAEEKHLAVGSLEQLLNPIHHYSQVTTHNPIVERRSLPSYQCLSSTSFHPVTKAIPSSPLHSLPFPFLADLRAFTLVSSPNNLDLARYTQKCRPPASACALRNRPHDHPQASRPECETRFSEGSKVPHRTRPLRLRSHKAFSRDYGPVRSA